MFTPVIRIFAAGIGIFLSLCGTAAAITPTVVTYKPILVFSVESPFVANQGRWAGKTISPGDLLTSWGEVIPNGVLTRNFYPMPPKGDYGLDAVFAPATFSAVRETLFSTTSSFFDERLGRTVGKGDILSDRGAVVMANSQLMAKFGPRSSPTGPTLADYGLDGFQMPVLSTSRFSAAPGVLFSTEQPFYSDTLGRTVGEGDLLSSAGQVVLTNGQLLNNFHLPPTMTAGFAAVDYGLDGFRRMGTETWFTTKKGFFDTALGTWVGRGDLLSTAGKVVLTNRQLLSPFLKPNADSTAIIDYGLDAFWTGYLPIYRPFPDPYANPVLAADVTAVPADLDPSAFFSAVPEPATLLFLILALPLVIKRGHG